MTFQLPADWLILAAGALLAAGVIGAGFAHRLRIPSILLFLALGMVIADDGLGLVTLDDPTVAQIGGTVALLLILYEGGLTTKPRDARQAAVPGILLATAAVVLTAAVVAGAAILLLDLDPITALLIGAVVSSTDAAAVFTVLRRAPLPRRLTSLLEVESGVNDPTAIMLTIGVLETWRADPAAWQWAAFGVQQLGGGLVMGLAVGWVGAWLLNRAHLGTAGLYPVLALGVAGLAYGTAAAVGASGFLAVYVTGLLVGARVPRHRRTIRSFHDGLANTAEIGLFLMLGMLVFPSRLPGVIVPGLVIAAILVLVARPLAVLACLVWFRYRREDLVLMSWAGLRGAVPVVLATFPFTAGYPEGNFIFDMVFFVVLVSAALQGGTIGVLAGWLGLRDEGRVWAPVAEALPLDDAHTELLEVHMTDDLAVVGRQLRDAPLPSGALLTAIVRGNRTLVPTAGTRLQTGDLLIVAMPRQPDATSRLVRWARGEGRGGEGSSPVRTA